MDVKKTITSIFMVPTLKVPKNELRNNGFLNGYIRDDIKGSQYENSIYLLFRPDQLSKFKVFLEGEYERTKDIIEDYDYPNGFIVVVYQLNVVHKYDFALVRQGKYSKTSIKFQNDFPSKIEIFKGGELKEEASLQYRIFNRTSDLIHFWEDKFAVTFGEDQEIWRGFEEEEEILTEEKLREYEQE